MRVGNIVVVNFFISLIRGARFILPPRMLCLATLLGCNLHAGVFSTDFNTERLMGAQTFGDASMEKTGGIMNSGVLKLTSPRSDGNGTLILDELDPGKDVVSFSVKFRVAIGSTDRPAANDGISVNFSSDLPKEIGSEGAGNGLTISFGSYLSAKDLPISAIKIKYQGTNVVGSYFSLRTDTNFADVEIQLDADGALTIIYNGATAYDHSRLFDYKPLAGRFGIGATTGSGAASHFIDDLWIRTQTEAPPRVKSRQRSTRKTQLLPEYSVRAWHVEDGLPQNMVQALVQTRDGYLWAGTRRGLARFDGSKFTVFNSESTSEIKDPIINALCAAKDGSLWIGTESGLVQLKDGEFTRYTNGLPSEQVKVIREISDGSLLVGTVKGLARYKDGKI
ncbi:MAG: hypothetical protein JWM68_1045, partial [Verrucomicrobiales bacterium]|nr:hypothetical protein [Verrucomicrobiales bacterium]